jgi:micrococcal nuclease
MLPNLFRISTLAVLAAVLGYARFPDRNAERIPNGTEFQARVVAITDGDTIRVLRDEHVQLKIRLHGIDCPESGQPFGHRAKEFTGDMVFGKTVTIRVMDTDRYGRTVAEVFLADGRVLNRELVRAGLAWWYRRYAPRDGELADLEREARQARRGLWADADPLAPWEWRRK